MSAPSPRLIKTLYKSLLKAASRLDAISPGASPLSLLPLLRSAPALPVPPASARSLSALARGCFPRAAGGAADEARLAAGFLLLREANERAAAFRGAPRAAAALAAGKPARVHFSVGHVVRHAAHGYAGVVLGWNATCEAGAEWCARNGVADPLQPFYTVLVDVRDRPEAQVTYVAQGALQLLSGGGGGGGGGGGADCFVAHPLLLNHFHAFDAASGTFAPRAELRASYPCDAPGWAPPGAARGVAASRAAAAGARAFVEEGDDPEPEAEPEAVPVKL
jgi:hemimethylated DNA binding protein